MAVQPARAHAARTGLELSGLERQITEGPVGYPRNVEPPIRGVMDEAYKKPLSSLGLSFDTERELALSDGLSIPGLS